MSAVANLYLSITQHSHDVRLVKKKRVTDCVISACFHKIDEKLREDCVERAPSYKKQLKKICTNIQKKVQEFRKSYRCISATLALRLDSTVT